MMTRSVKTLFMIIGIIVAAIVLVQIVKGTASIVLLKALSIASLIFLIIKTVIDLLELYFGAND